MTPLTRRFLAAFTLSMVPGSPTVWAAPTASAADRALVKQLDREVVALRQTIARLESERDACGATAPAAVYRDLVQVLQGEGALTVARDGAHVTVTFPGAMLFGGGSAVRMEAEPSLDLFATVIKANPKVQVTIDAHVDGPRRGSTAWARSALEGPRSRTRSSGASGCPPRGSRSRRTATARPCRWATRPRAARSTTGSS